jgi:cation:H+ antiporter
VLLQSGILILAIFFLYLGAELTLESSEKIGKHFGLSPLVIGLLIVGFGTSLPEFFVSQLATYRGHPEIALGNIIGSNIANIFLIMGVASLLVPLHLNRKEITRQLIFHLLLTVGLISYMEFGSVTLWGSAFWGLYFLVYMYFTFSEMKKTKILNTEPVEEKDKLQLLMVPKLLGGFALLYLGGEWLVTSGSKLGQMAGISEYVISAIFVAFGTSFPELVTALLACYKKKDTDLITGNIIGSNIFNVAFVLGSLGVYQFEFNNNFLVEMVVLGTVSILLLVFSIAKKSLHRKSGIVLLGTYLALVTYWVQTQN